MSSDQAHGIWEQGWEGHEAHQRERMSSLPRSEKLRWLEQAHHLVLHMASVAPKPAERADKA